MTSPQHGAVRVISKRDNLKGKQYVSYRDHQSPSQTHASIEHSRMTTLRERLKEHVPAWAHYLAFYRSPRTRTRYSYLLNILLEINPQVRFHYLRAHLHHIINRAPRIAFVHLPKTGGTYLLRSLPQSGPMLNLSHCVIRRTKSDAWCPVGLWPHSPSLISGFFVFSTVRNPLNLLVSYYHHALGFGKHLNLNHYDHENAKRGFRYLVETIMNRDDAWPSRKFLYPQLFDQEGNCITDWINRTEELDADVQQMCAHQGLTFEQQEPERVSPKGSFDDYFDDELIQRVSDHYHREMRIFGYDGREVVTPSYNLKPFDKSKLRYDYLSDELSES